MKGREIKFRHWNKLMRRMDYPGHCDIAVVRENDTYIPMQYIGLKDRNGKEIYEDDILTVQVRNEFGSLTEINVRMRWYPEGAGFLYFRPDGGGNDNIATPPWEAVVIGNFYENPDLLKA